MRKILTILLSLVLIAGSVAVGYETYADSDPGYEDDVHTTSSVSMFISNASGGIVSGKTGEYTVGDDFYFRIRIHASSSSIGDDVALKINFQNSDGTQSQNVSDFGFRANTSAAWGSGAAYLETDTDTNTNYHISYSGDHEFYFKAKFNATGVYKVNYTANCPNKYILRGVGYLTIKSNGTFSFSSIEEEEEESTTEKISDDNNIRIDGIHYETVKDGGKVLLPDDATVGYLETRTKKLYSRRFEIRNVTSDLNFISIDSVAVRNGTGASITVDGTNAIRFRTYVIIKNLNGDDITSTVVKSGVIQLGTMFTTQDYFTEELGSSFKKNDVMDLESNGEIDSSVYADVLNPYDDWPKDENNDNKYGTCYAGVFRVASYNFSRSFVASGYARLDYQNYSGTIGHRYFQTQNKNLPMGSLKSVAQKIKANGYAAQGFSQAEIDVLEGYCNAD